MTYTLIDQNGTTTIASSQATVIKGGFDTVDLAINYLKEIVAARKWTIIDIEVDEDFADIAAASGQSIHTFTIEAQ